MLMAVHHLPLFSFNFSNIVPQESKSPLLETKKFVVLRPIHCTPLTNQAQTITRRSANYHPSIWHDDYIQSLNNTYKDKFYVKKSKELKEKVRVILCKLIDHVDQLEMIDKLERLGVAYHFNIEIRSILKSVHNNIDMLKRKNNLYATSLAFRLLRQYGFDISTDVFDNFLDEMGNFDKYIFVDVKGLLSLYEASFYSMENELLLDEARAFTINPLKEFVNMESKNDKSLLIEHALEFPLKWRVPRCEALWFIKFLFERRQDSSCVILQFAELDFNMVQSIYQEELKYTSRWWKRIGLAKELSFFRDRLVENYVWAMGMNFHPELANLREVTTMVINFITTIDDIYDVYGTLDELELFTKAIDSWDLKAMDYLPHYMKICFLALYNFVNDVAFMGLKQNGYNIIPYLNKAWSGLCKSYLIEAKWYHSGYTPRLEEYMENAWISISIPLVLTHAYFLIPSPYKKDDLVCLEKYSNIIRSSSIICRLADDLGTYKREMKTGDVPKSIQCYMNERGGSEAEAEEHIHDMISKTWKKMNEEGVVYPFSDNIKHCAINLATTALFVYQHGDGFNIQDHDTNTRIKKLIMQPISLI